MATLACAGATTPASPETSLVEGRGAQLRVGFEGVRELEGTLVCALFADQASFDSSAPPLRATVLPLAAEGVEWALELPLGTYAVKVFQDLDNDGELDRGALGRPTEPYGFSNDARGRFGPPSWQEAHFEIDRPELRIEIGLE